ncbi:nucleotidyltransferase family protein [Paenibacillus sp. GCM10027626]|uniref:nucleotidyltransferase family protein n=1 Tax=Paenibacillus sp. GCM10027626 TaxID=3273411 RepID=UPI0036345D74
MEEKLIAIMKENMFLERDLQLVQQLGLPNWCIAAGYVRNFVWDYLAGNPQRSPMNDVDVLYYDSNDLDETREKEYEARLIRLWPEYDWSVKNQARMHLRNDEPPYESVEDAMKHWPETATAVGITLDEKQQLKVIAPFGLDDLFAMIIRRSPFFADRDYFCARIQRKGWLKLWPQVRLIDSAAAVQS